MGLIGRGWKPCEGWSRPVLIGRGLAHKYVSCSHPLCDPEHTTMFHPFLLPVWGCGGGVVCSVGESRKSKVESRKLICLWVFGGEWEPPGPIKTRKANPPSADGTALAGVWESRSPPTSNVLGGDPRRDRRGSSHFRPV